MKSASEIENSEVRALARRAESFVAGCRWCAEVRSCAAAFAIAGVVGVFRVDLTPVRPDVDSTVWVVVGDIPPAYIAFDDGDDWQDALRGYTDEMQKWVDAVRAGASIEELVPVNVSPTREHAEILAGRLQFIRDRLVNVDPASLESDV
ncbi:MAG TPA: hypothetical protein VJU82_15080 [Acidobacteriaceae bacterium]|nr:hypothetical protein [Acidobacteriaceae bacterium]